jgi:hypothetical protein
VIDLHGEGAPRLTRSCTEDAWKSHLVFELPDRFADADRNGWHEVVLRIDVDPKRGCGCAVFRIRYEGEPTGFSLNTGLAHQRRQRETTGPRGSTLSSTCSVGT